VHPVGFSVKMGLRKLVFPESPQDAIKDYPQSCREFQVICLRKSPMGGRRPADDRENTERAIVQLVGRDIAGKVSQHGVHVLDSDVLFRLFSPRPPPSSGSWRKERRRGDLARDAN